LRLRLFFKGGIIIPKKSLQREQAIRERDKIIQLCKEGKSLYDISDAVGINRVYIRELLDREGIRKSKTKEERNNELRDNINQYSDKIVQCYKAGKSIGSIKKILKEEDNCNMSLQCIREIVNKNTIIRRTRKGYQKYTCNDSKFSSYDKFSCYWAGLLAADGCIYERKNSDIEYIILTLTDKETVMGFKEYIEYTGEVTQINKTTTIGGAKGKIEVWEVRCNSKNICKNLRENFNITPRKTNTYTPPQIPYELIKYFILGYIDGDGCITYSKTNTERKQFALNITGTYQIIEYIQTYLGKTNLKTFQRNPQNGKNNVSITIQGNDQLLAILSSLYDDNEIVQICMQRKYERFLLLKEQQERKMASA